MSHRILHRCVQEKGKRLRREEVVKRRRGFEEGDTLGEEEEEREPVLARNRPGMDQLDWWHYQRKLREALKGEEKLVAGVVEVVAGGEGRGNPSSFEAEANDDPESGPEAR